MFAEVHRRLHENASAALAAAALAIDSREEGSAAGFSNPPGLQSEISILERACVHFGFVYPP